MFIELVMAATTVTTPAFPEKMPALIENCLNGAVIDKDVRKTDDSYKYICAGEAAQKLWEFLEAAKIETFEQTPKGDVGRWLSRVFPLGGCFKRLSDGDNAPTPEGLSCTIWIPRKAS